MTYRVDALSELMPWLLGWGTSVEVLDPPEFRMALRNQAAGLVEILT
jgi:predicted DNA-binding transcriptional regulator YafY